MKEYKYIFFDFDDTIVNTINGTRELALYALNYFGINESDNKNLGRDHYLRSHLVSMI